MKKFMSKISALCLTVLAGAMFTGCSNSEEVTPQTQPQTGKFTLTVMAEKQGGTRALAIGDVNNDGNADIVATWTAGDEVQVYDATTGTALTGVLTAESSGASTRLTGTVEGTLSEGDELRLTYLSNDYSGQDGTLQYIAQHCDYAEATVTVGKVEAGVITPTGTASFANAQAIVKFMLTEVTGAGINAESLTVGYGSESLSLTIPAATYATNGNGVLYVALPPFAQQTVSLTATLPSFFYTYRTSDAVSLAAGQYQPISVQMAKDPHEYVDLGLPSGTLWATCNVGANSPEEYGDYFAWGETVPYGGEDQSNAMNYAYADTYTKTYYDWDTYKYCNGSQSTLTKYCNNSEYGYNGFTDNLTELTTDDDAATANWGSAWRMPSYEQFTELINSSYTTTEWTTVNGVYGRKITSKMSGYTNRSIFLPAAGYRGYSSLYYAGSSGYYWSRTLRTSSPSGARHLYFSSSGISTYYGSGRYYGFTVRPVRSSE